MSKNEIMKEELSPETQSTNRNNNLENSKMEYDSDVSRMALCSEQGSRPLHNILMPKAALPKITVSLTEPEGGNKRYSTGSDYADWGNRLAKQQSSDGGIGKFFDGMGIERGVLEPMLSIQYANVHPASSSSLNLLESASTAGCILDTDQDNCDRRSELDLPGIIESTSEGNNDLNVSENRQQQRQPTPEDTNNRIMQWLTTVSPTNASQDDAT